MSVLTLLASGSSGPAVSQELYGRSVSGVVEVFTSQGCAACEDVGPLIQGYANDRDVAAVAYHVDYWDYLGWQDRLAAPRNTSRQKAYAKRLASGLLTTPQVVVNGRQALAGVNRPQVDGWLARTAIRSGPDAPSILLKRSGDRLKIEARDVRAGAQVSPSILVLITFARNTRTTISSGENRDHTSMDMRPVVDWRILGLASSETALRLEIPLWMGENEGDEEGGCLALLQAMSPGGEPGEVLAASLLEF